MHPTQHAVVIAGGGPTGMMLAGELALAGIDIAVVERRHSQDLPESRAGGLHARTIEVFDQRGIADRFLRHGEVSPLVGFATTSLDVSCLPSRHNYMLGLWQNRIEHELAGWVEDLGVPIVRGCEVTGFAQDDTGVDIEISDGGPLRAEYFVGCDGGRSLIRKTAGIDFPGWNPTFSCLIAEVEVDHVPEWITRKPGTDDRPSTGAADGIPVRLVVPEQHIKPSGEATLRELSETLIAAYGSDYGVHNPKRISRFADTTRQAASYRDRRVLLAGDAAHVHAPVGGQGLNLGVQDAVNLGWKLAQVVKETSPESLLDTYHAERHPVAARVLRHTMAQTALLRQDERIQALRDITYELLCLHEPGRRVAAMMSGLDIHYDLGEGHPSLGRRMPDLDLITVDGPQRTFTLLHQARPVLLNLGNTGGFDITPWADRVRALDAKTTSTWELPVLGEIAAPAAVLLRPDGYVAWAGDLTDPRLPDALTAWFGNPQTR
jgi:2-polyprenyl-6-methoxyphenol hydroxylase-like FAD-dependent oxidoreductase